VPAKILVKVDNGAVQTLENAEVRLWNDNISASWPAAERPMC
jgi:hypothetical protein